MKLLLQIGNVLSLAFALVANALVGAQVLDVESIKDVSDRYATLLTPATYAFSIWSVIYIGLVVFAVYQARDVLKPDAENTIPERAGWFFVLANVCNGLWTYVFVQGLIGLSLVVIALHAEVLFALLWRLKIATGNVSVPVITMVWWPLLLYTGWVAAASVVNTASWLASLGVVISPITASIVLVLFGLGLLALLKARAVRELVLASTWGIAAIGVRQLGESMVVSVVALSLSVVLIGAVVWHGYRNRLENPLFDSMARLTGKKPV